MRKISTLTLAIVVLAAQTAHAQDITIEEIHNIVAAAQTTGELRFTPTGKPYRLVIDASTEAPNAGIRLRKYESTNEAPAMYMDKGLDGFMDYGAESDNSLYFKDPDARKNAMAKGVTMSTKDDQEWQLEYLVVLQEANVYVKAKEERQNYVQGLVSGP